MTAFSAVNDSIYVDRYRVRMIHALQEDFRRADRLVEDIAEALTGSTPEAAQLDDQAKLARIEEAAARWHELGVTLSQMRRHQTSMIRNARRPR